MYVLCFIFPPLAVLLQGRIVSFLFNIVFSLLGFFPGVAHALWVVSDARSTRRTRKQTKQLVKEIRKQRLVTA